MKYILLTFKNIQKFILLHPVMFMLFIAVQIICCIAAFITSGMAYNMFYVGRIKSESTIYKISFEKNYKEIEDIRSSLKEDENGNKYYLRKNPSSNSNQFIKSDKIEYEGIIPISEMRNKVNIFREKLKEYNVSRIDLFLVPNKTLNFNDTNPSFFTSVTGDYLNKNSVIDKIYLESNDKIIVSPITDYGYQIGKTYKINGYDYKCVAEREGIPFIPYNSLDDNFCVYLIYIFFDKPLTNTEIQNGVTPVFDELFKNHIQDSFPPDPYVPIDMDLNKMIYVIAIAVMVIILIAIAKFYSYVLSDRKKALAIMRLCGCSREKIHIMYMLEIFLTMVVTSAAGFMMFKYIFFETIADMYPSFKEFYKEPVFFIVLGAYILLSMIIMTIIIVPSTKATITDMKKET